MKTFNEIKALVVVAILACQPVYAVQVWDAKVTGSSQFSVTHKDPLSQNSRQKTLMNPEQRQLQQNVTSGQSVLLNASREIIDL